MVNFGPLAAEIVSLVWGATCIRQGGHHVGHWPTFLVYIFFLAYSQPSQIWCLPYFHTWCGLSANLGCKSEVCCSRLAGNAGPKKSPKIAICAPSGNFVRLCLRNYASIDDRKNLLNSNISSTCPHNIANFAPLTAEIGWHPSKFQPVSRLGFVTVATSLTAGQPNFARCLAVS